MTANAIPCFADTVIWKEANTDLYFCFSYNTDSQNQTPRTQWIQRGMSLLTIKSLGARDKAQLVKEYCQA